MASKKPGEDGGGTSKSHLVTRKGQRPSGYSLDRMGARRQREQGQIVPGGAEWGGAGGEEKQLLCEG